MNQSISYQVTTAVRPCCGNNQQQVQVSLSLRPGNSLQQRLISSFLRFSLKSVLSACLKPTKASVCMLHPTSSSSPPAAAGYTFTGGLKDCPSSPPA